MKTLLMMLLMISVPCIVRCEDKIIHPVTEELKKCLEKSKKESVSQVRRYSQRHVWCRQLLRGGLIHAEGPFDIELIWVAPFFGHYGALSVFWKENCIYMVLMNDSEYLIATHVLSPSQYELIDTVLKHVRNYEYAYTLSHGSSSLLGVFLKEQEEPRCFDVQYANNRTVHKPWYCGDEDSVNAYRFMEGMHDFFLRLYNSDSPVRIYEGKREKGVSLPMKLAADRKSMPKFVPVW